MIETQGTRRAGSTVRTGGIWTATLLLSLLFAGCQGSAGPEDATDEADFAALVAETGPDWAVVEDYTERSQAWMAEQMKRMTAGDQAEGDDHAERPDQSRAVAAATAILDQGGAHEKTTQAAEFLVNFAGDEHGARGARALLELVPDYANWSMLLQRMDMRRGFGADGEPSGPETEAFLADLATNAQDPLLQAFGRYYVASGQMESVNVPSLPAEEYAVRRERALEAAEGLSAGVEGEKFPGGAHFGQTWEEVEADLIQSIRYATVGATPPELVGTTLDGVEESLADYRGRVVLLDFWATWCKPCIAALPELRQMVTDLPADRFTLLAISVDATQDLVDEFMVDEPMPFVNWYVGQRSDIVRALNVNSYPTYILLGDQGEILARAHSLRDDFVALLNEAVANGPKA